jgi:two-component system response regulator HydG
VLETGRFRLVGGEKEVSVDVRLLAATNRDLLADIEVGRFREDLYYRVNVIQVDVPPLRARGTDILLLAKNFVSACAARSGKPVTGITRPAAEKLLAYAWPGNVRELRNVIERAVALTNCDKLLVEDLPDRVRNFQSERLVLDGQDPSELVTIDEMERRYINHVLSCVGQSKVTAARILGVDRTTLYRKLKGHGVDSDDGERDSKERSG